MGTNLLQLYVSLLVERIRTKRGSQSKLGNKFDLKKFKTLQNYTLMEQYAQEYLQRLGSGSSRTAFLMSGRYVLKIAINQRGIAQNQAEVDVFTNPKSKPLVATVRSADPEYRWLVSDLVKPLKSPEEFKQLTNVDWNTFRDYLQQKDPSKLSTNNVPEFIKHALATMQQNDLMPGDLRVIDHWGKTPDGRCVLLDYGFTHEVWNEHYADKDSTQPVDQVGPTINLSKLPSSEQSTAVTKKGGRPKRVSTLDDPFEKS